MGEGLLLLDDAPPKLMQLRMLWAGWGCVLLLSFGSGATRTGFGSSSRSLSFGAGFRTGGSLSSSLFISSGSLRGSGSPRRRRPLGSVKY
jgi:hypothetical protein